MFYPDLRGFERNLPDPRDGLKKKKKEIASKSVHYSLSAKESPCFTF